MLQHKVLSLFRRLHSRLTDDDSVSTLSELSDVVFSWLKSLGMDKM